jgi:hypothetical protein
MQSSLCGREERVSGLHGQLRTRHANILNDSNLPAIHPPPGG